MARKPFTETAEHRSASAELRRLRETTGATLEWMAQALGISIRSLSRYEQAQRTIPHFIITRAREIAERKERGVVGATALERDGGAFVNSFSFRHRVNRFGVGKHFIEARAGLTKSRLVRVDWVLDLGNERFAAVDLTAPTGNFLGLGNAKTEAEAQEFSDLLSAELLEHAELLGSAAYLGQFTQAPAFVIMFLQTQDVVELVRLYAEREKVFVPDRVLLASDSSIGPIARAARWASIDRE